VARNRETLFDAQQMLRQRGTGREALTGVQQLLGAVGGAKERDILARRDKKRYGRN